MKFQIRVGFEIKDAGKPNYEISLNADFDDESAKFVGEILQMIDTKMGELKLKEEAKEL